MKAHPDHLSILRTLKVTLKSKGQTYATLAGRLGLSEVTVKRIFAGHACSLERMATICDELGVSFLDVAAHSREREEADYPLNRAQEEYFAEKPAHFAILKELARGLAPQQIAREWQLDPPKLHRILRALERLGLLEVLPADRVRIPFRGNIRMSPKGAFVRKIVKPQISTFLDHVDRTIEEEDVCMHSAEMELSRKHVDEFVDEIHALGAKYRAHALKDRSLLPGNALVSTRWLFAFAPFRTDWKRYKA